MNPLSSRSATASPRSTPPEISQIKLEDLPDEMLSLIFSKISLTENTTLSSLARVSHRMRDHVSVASLKSYFLAAERAFPMMQVEQKMALIGNLSTWLLQIEEQMPASDVVNCWDRLCDMTAAGSLDIFQHLECLNHAMYALLTSPLIASDEGSTLVSRFEQALNLAVTNVTVALDRREAA